MSHRTRHLALPLLVAGLVLALLLAAAPPDAGAAHRCGGITFTPNTEDGVYDIRASGVACRRARRVARAVRPLGITEGPYAYTQSGFRCRGRFSDDALPQVAWTCRRGAARITFVRA